MLAGVPDDVAGEGADSPPAAAHCHRMMNSLLRGRTGFGISATIKLPHSHIILHHAGKSDTLRLAEEGCWCL
jgi:hypothetical protein